MVVEKGFHDRVGEQVSVAKKGEIPKDSTLRRKAFRFKIAARTVFLGQGIVTVSLGYKK